MLYTILITIHAIVCIFLITIVLIQAGRGGGLAESFTGAESIFGTKTNAVLTRATTFFAVFFFITCLSLAVLAKQRSSSLIRGPLPQAALAPKETAPEKEKHPNEGADESGPQIKEKASDAKAESQSRKSQ